MKKLLILILLVMVGAPQYASASYHLFTCTDGLTVAGGVSCSSPNIYDGFTAGAGYVGDKPTNVYPLTSGGTYYLTVDYDGSGRITFGNEGDVSTPSTEILGITGAVLEQSFTASTGTDNITFYFYGGTGAGGHASNNFTGELYRICLDDDGVSCTPPPPPPPPSPIEDIFVGVATSSIYGTTTAFIAIVEIPNLTLFLGILLFYLTFAGVVYFFRK